MVDLDYDIFNRLDDDGYQKGYDLQKIIHKYYSTLYDVVIDTGEGQYRGYDKGIDLVAFNRSNRSHRIGVQVKNQKKYIKVNQVASMVDRAIDFYGLTEIHLVTRSDIRFSAIDLIDKYNIKVIGRDKVENIIRDMKKLEHIDTRDEREILYSIFNSKGSYYKVDRTTILELIEKRPKTTIELYGIYGLGNKRVREYGEDLVNYFKQTDK